jgi:hypothetical protein
VRFLTISERVLSLNSTAKQQTSRHNNKQRALHASAIIIVPA